MTNHLIPTSLRGIAGRLGLFAMERMLRLVLGVFVGIAVARHLGPAAFGVLNYAMATVSVFTVLLGVGTEGIIIRDFVRSPEVASRIMAAGLMIRFACGLVLFLVSTAFAFWFVTPTGGMRSLVLIQSVVLLLSWPDVIDCWFQADARPHGAVLARMAAGVVTAGVRVLLIAGRAGPAAFAVANIVECAVLGIALLLALRLRADRPALLRQAQVRDEMRRLLIEGWPLAFSSVLVMLTLQLDRIMVARLCSAEEMGRYAASSRFFDVMLLLPLLMGMAAQRLFAIEGGGSGQTVGIQSLRTLHQVTLISVLAAAAISLASGLLVRVAYGPAFAGAGRVLALQVWATVLVTHVSLRTRMLVAAGRVRAVMLLALPPLLLHALLLKLMVPRMGGLGAALSTLLAWLAAVLIFPLFAPGTRIYILVFLNTFGLPIRSKR